MSHIDVENGALDTEHDHLLQRIATLEQTECEYHRLQHEYQHLLSRIDSLEATNAELKAHITTLQQRQTLLEGFVEHSPGLLYVKDMYGRYVLVNQRTAALLHRDPDQIIGKTGYELVSDHVASALCDHDCQVMTTGKPLEEERYRLMADHATDMISRHAPDGTYLYASPICYSLLGYTPEELVGRNSYDFFHPDDRATIQTSHTTILNSVGSHAVSYRTRHKDGRYIWFETTGKTIRDAESGAVVEILAISRDITEWKRIEIELEQSLALLQATLDSTADGIIVSTLDQRIISHNQKFRQMWQLPEDWESLPDTPAERLTFLAQQVTDPQSFTHRIEEVSCMPEAEAYDIIELCDGRIFERYSTPYRVAGRIAGRVWSFRDVTSQKQAEAEVRASRTRLQAIFDNAAVGIVLFDSAGHFVAVNNRAADMLRCSVDDIMGRMNVQDTTHPEDREKSNERLQALIDGTSDGYRIERRILRRDGSMFWGDIATTTIRHGNGSLEAIIAVVADITERKEAEAMLQQVNEQLKQQALRDPLTGLFNRRYLNETLPRELQRASRQQHPLSVVLLDIDHFKRFNDTYGHDAGDAVLRAVGSVLQMRIRGEDVVCRYGGEEFVLILPGASLEDTWRRAEELRTRIRYLAIEHNGHPLEVVTISVGIAAFPQHGTASDTLMKVADSALYRAKARGRDCTVVADMERESWMQASYQGQQEQEHLCNGSQDST